MAVRPIVCILRLPALLAVLLVSGCTLTGPRYGAHVTNTLALREAGLAKVNVGEVQKSPTAEYDVDHVNARAMTVLSAYGSYTAYVREALRIEFDHADLLAADSAIRIDGVLLQNEMSGNARTEYTLIEVELTVTRDGANVYRAAKTARHEWESAFVGEVAIPRAIANYQVGVQRLIAAFIADPAFVAALEKR